jgi:hypothetical protein
MSRAHAVCGIALCASAVAFAAGCRRDGCLGGDDGQCMPVAACRALTYACGSLPGTVKVTTSFARMPGPKAHAATNVADPDVELSNDLVRIVLDAPGHAQNLAPSGGTILDFAPIGTTSGDQTNSIYQAAGLLPRDAVHYDSWTYSEHPSPDVTQHTVTAFFRGHLEGDPRVTVVTRYELRPCEPGVRVTTDLYNGAPDANTLYLTDGLFWGDNTLAPFVPGEGLGFRLPDLDLLHIDLAWRQWPFLAARSQAPPDVAYAVVPCDRGFGAGFNSTTLSASGVPLAPTLPGDGLHYERFILATPGPGLAPAVAAALQVRTEVHGDPAPVPVTGRVVVGGVPFDGQAGRAASLLFYEPAPGGNPDDPAHRVPWSEAVPATDGTFQVTLPRDRSYRVQPYAFGLPAGPALSFAVAHDPVSIGDLTLTASARLHAIVRKTADNLATYAELVVIPAGSAESGTPPTFYGLFPGCDPMLGPPHGGTPACNRALTANGVFDLLLPAGEYYVYATRGPFATLDRAQITVRAGDDITQTFLVQDLVVLDRPNILSVPKLGSPGTFEEIVSGDFHVHGAASYDSSIPDQDRVVSFLAAGLDVVVATDHDVVTNYASALSLLSGSHSLVVIPGVEQTPNILWFDVPGQDFPKTLGHFNFWPLEVNTTLPRNGAPWDELQEPGAMMDAMESLFTADGVNFNGAGVRQLNHPYALTKLGRDQGFTRAIGYDPRTPIEAGKSFAADVLLRAPSGGHRNVDWDVQEVMTGASRADWLRYRTLWFSMLTQGLLRAGAANSDTHSLGLEQAGYPRNLVFGDYGAEVAGSKLDVDAFNADVKSGHMVGTTGPVLDAIIDDGMGNQYRPGLTPITVTPGIANLVVSVQVAPWIPVQEIRVYVNGRLKMTQNVEGYFLTSKIDPVTQMPVRIDPFSGNSVPIGPIRTLLSSLTSCTNTPPTFKCPDSKDVWLVVEAGMHQDPACGELLPEVVPVCDDLPAAAGHSPCVCDTDDDGLPDLPDADVPIRPDPTDPRFHVEAIAPGVWPVAFSNPFLLNIDGGDWVAPGLP